MRWLEEIAVARKRGEMAEEVYKRAQDAKTCALGEAFVDRGLSVQEYFGTLPDAIRLRIGGGFPTMLSLRQWDEAERLLFAAHDFADEWKRHLSLKEN